MIITKEIPAEQVRALDLHQGDSLRVIAVRNGGTLLIQIERSEEPSPPRRGLATAWVQRFAGIAKPSDGKSSEEIREEHYRQKYGL